MNRNISVPCQNQWVQDDWVTDPALRKELMTEIIHLVTLIPPELHTVQEYARLLQLEEVTLLIASSSSPYGNDPQIINPVCEQIKAVVKQIIRSENPSYIESTTAPSASQPQPQTRQTSSAAFRSRKPTVREKVLGDIVTTITGTIADLFWK